MKNKAISIFLSLCIAMTFMSVQVLAANRNSPFQDVPEGSWFYDAVMFVNANRLMTGTTSTTFNPQSNLTRAAAATALYRMDGEPAVMDNAIFSDVPEGKWYSKSIAWAYRNGIVSGYDTNTFGTNDYITREQFAAMIFRYAQYKDYDLSESLNLSKYSDAGNISSWALGAMRWAVSNELITGITETTLEPDGRANRAQCAEILMRFIQNFAMDDNIFAHLSDVAFIFASGAGGWSTEVEINDDGSFIGYYHDSEMGDMDPKYPNGTYYESRFEGKFILNKKIDNFTYSIKLEELNVEGIIGEEKIVNGVRIITSDAFGFDNADEFLLYLPGKSTSGLPEEFLDWVRMPLAWDVIPNKLPFYGLYNVTGQQGFFSD